MHAVLKYTGKKFPKSIVNNTMQYTSPSPDLPALKWGRENETTAREHYSTQEKEKHTSFETRLSGLIINPLYPWIAASPNGISSCDCCRTKLLEIKCPYTIRDISPVSDEALSNRTYCLTKGVDHQVMLSRKHKYYTQIQCQLLVADIVMTKFIVYVSKRNRGE